MPHVLRPEVAVRRGRVKAQAEAPAADWFRYAFIGLANACAASYGGPVYLCGSALRKAKPGDFDVRVVVSDVDMRRLFGPDKNERKDGDCWNEREWRIARERLKQSRRFSRATRVNVDFQIQSEDEAARHENEPRLRLDKAPDGFFRAGRGEP